MILETIQWAWTFQGRGPPADDFHCGLAYALHFFQFSVRFTLTRRGCYILKRSWLGSRSIWGRQ